MGQYTDRLAMYGQTDIKFEIVVLRGSKPKLGTLVKKPKYEKNCTHHLKPIAVPLLLISFMNESNFGSAVRYW